MKSNRIVIAAVLFLAAGLYAIFAYCNGTTGLNLGYPVSGTSVHIDVTTTGIPVLIGLPCLGAGALLLIIAFFAAIVSLFRHREAGAVAAGPSRRDIPFEE